ncbi:MAG: hypothetical protein HQ534_00845 [Armatimonadetes bacterium]|nr:hypothetical protein [Armatimonadota bacterium]
MKKIAYILIVLILILFGLIFIRNLRKEKLEAIIIIAGNQEFFLKNLSKIEMQEIKTKSEDKFSAASIQKILELFEIHENKFIRITFISEDGAGISFKKDEIPKLFLVQEKEKKQKKFRLIVPDDEFKQRWLKNIKYIELS